MSIHDFAPLQCGENLQAYDALRTGLKGAAENISRRQITMLKLGNNIRLTSKEIERFTKITGFRPDVKTIDDLDAYVEQCKRYYWGVSEDTRFLHWLIDKERSRCFGTA